VSPKDPKEKVPPIPIDPKTGKSRIWIIEPVDVITFCVEYAGLTSVSKAQEKVLRGIFDVKRTANTFFNINQAILRIGQGGGKNFTITAAVSYLIYLWCCLYDPHGYFGKFNYENFDILNFSQVNEAQAKNVFFRTLSSMMRQVRDPEDGENWYAKHMGFRIKEYGQGDIKDKSMIIPNRHKGRGMVRVFCLDTTAKSVEGYTIWVSIMDEPSRANTLKLFEKAQHQYRTAYTNQKTRFRAYQRLTMVFSYPEQEVNDVLVWLYNLYSELHKENDFEINEDEGVLTAWYWNWIFNAFNSTQLKTDYEKDYARDPVDANRRYKAIIPPSAFGFFNPYLDTIADAFNPELKSPVEWQQIATVRREKVKGQMKDVQYVALELLNVKGDDRERYWGGDFSKTGDKFVIVSGYGEKTKREDSIVNYERDKKTGEEVKIETIVECKPIIDIILIWDPGKGHHPVDYQNVEDIIKQMILNHFPSSRGFHFDAYNTESMKQKILDIGLSNCDSLPFGNPQQVKLGRTTRHLVWHHGIEIITSDILKMEMQKLVFENNNKIDHPSGGSKDIWDALIIAVQDIVENIRLRSMVDIGDKDPDVDELDARVKVYHNCLLKFVRHHKRSPKDNGEIARYMREECNQQVFEEDIEYLHEAWNIWRADLDAQILGVREYHEKHGLAGTVLTPDTTDTQRLIDTLSGVLYR